MPLYNPPQTPLSVTTKGDLQTYSTTPARLPVGSNGYKLIANSNETTGLQYIAPDGWTPALETWTYASASTITVPSGAASKYAVGDKIKWTQTTVKYGVITAVADTTLTILVNTDYTVADAAISSNYYSHQINPIGYPTWFNCAAPTWYGDTDNGSGGQPVTTSFKQRMVGKILMGSLLGGTAYKVGTNAIISFIVPINAASISDNTCIGNAFVRGTGGERLPGVCTYITATNRVLLYTSASMADNLQLDAVSYLYSYEI